MKIETCQNCGRTIGKLEQACVHHNQIVCKKCYSILSSEPTPSATGNIDNDKIIVHSRQNVVRTNVKQGALLGGCVCFLLGLILMFVSLWSFILYVPFFLAAFILSIVAMAQARVAGGVFLLIGTIIIPPILFFYKATENVTKKVSQKNLSTQTTASKPLIKNTNQLINKSVTPAPVKQTPTIKQQVQVPSVNVDINAADLEFYNQTFGTTTILTESAINGDELLTNEQFNWTELKYKLNLLAIDLEINDTPRHFNLINEAEAAHKRRMELLHYFQQHNLLAYQDFYDMLKTAQTGSHQRKLMYIKARIIEAYKEVTVSELKLYQDIKDHVEDYARKIEMKLQKTKR